MISPRLTLLCLPLALLCACSNNSPTPQSSSSTSDKGPVQEQISSALKQASVEARAKLANGNFKLSGEGSSARAEITPAGDFLIDGQAVQLTAQQRALMLKYRTDLLAVASAGIELGIQGADLGVRAATEAVIGALSGNGDEVKQRIEAEADKIKANAAVMCDHLPALRASQDALAAALPAFAPYARVDQVDVEGCKSDVTANTASKDQAAKANQ